MGIKSKGNIPNLPIFAYGTLLPGQPNHHFLGECIKSSQNASFPNGRLYNMGYYPMLIEEGNDDVQGILFTIEPVFYDQSIKNIDDLEGRAWVYVGSPEFVVDFQPIESSSWIHFIKEDINRIKTWWQDISSVKGLNEIDL